MTHMFDSGVPALCQLTCSIGTIPANGRLGFCQKNRVEFWSEESEESNALAQ